jgi:hypothetical protein
MFNFRLQVTALAYATQKLFLGDAVLNSTALQLTNSSTALTNNWPDGLPSFLELRVGSDPSDTQFIWGDVLKGIEEMSHNVTAALLTLQLGTMSAKCFFDRQVVVYQYSSFALWVPYGVSDLISLRL